MLEMNTIPGLTTESLIPQQAKAAEFHWRICLPMR
jgi:D-alanine-D-alanine ligase-like ATP-grasp enzyme